MRMNKLKANLLIPIVLVLLSIVVACKNGSMDPATIEFWAQRLDNSTWYQVTAAQVYEGEYCIIFVEDAFTDQVSAADAQLISSEFDTIIYPLITGKFGPVSDQDQDGKITILIMDIIDGGSLNSYVAGYFDANHQFSSESYLYSNEREMLFMDADPGVPGSSQFYMTIAHELQHLVNFNREYFGDEDGNGEPDQELQDTWINEGLSSAAEYLYNGGHINLKIQTYNDQIYGARNDIRNGKNFVQWDNSLANYATVYLFFQWLRIHADNDDGIYKQILEHVEPDYTAVEDVGNDNTLFSGFLWPDMLRSWFAANELNQSSGVLGYDGEITGIDPPYHTGGVSVDLGPGEGVYIDLGTPTLVAATPAGSIDYAGLTTSPPYVDTTGGEDYTSQVFLSYNFNGIPTGSSETSDTLPPSVSLLPGPAESTASRSLTAAPPELVPIGAIFYPDGTSSLGDGQE